MLRRIFVGVNDKERRDNKVARRNLIEENINSRLGRQTRKDIKKKGFLTGIIEFHC